MKIVVTLDGKKIKEYALDREIDKDSGSEIILWIGRSKSCFIILEKSQISREHAKLWYTDGHWKIQGLDSIRSIQVNGESVESALLKPDDIINIAPYTLKVSGDLSKDNFDVAEKNEEEKLEDHTDKQSKPIEDIEDIQEDGNEEEEKYSLKDTQNPEEEEYSLKDTQNAEETENDGESNGIASESFSHEEVSYQEEHEGQDVSSESEYSEGDSNEEGSEEEYAMEAVDDEAGEKTEIVSSFSKFILDLFGENVPYDVFTIETDKTFIGRDSQKCQIVLSDPEVSGVHAVIRKMNAQITLEDLKSGNGTILNGERINKRKLSNGDEFIIGSVTFTVRMESNFIKEEYQSLMPVEENQVVEVEEIVEVGEDFAGDDDSNSEKKLKDKSLIGQMRKLFTKDALQDPTKRKKLIYIVAGVLLLFIFLDDSDKKVVSPSKKKNVKVKNKVLKKKNNLDPKVLEFVDSTYQLALELFERAKYQECIHQLDALFQKTPNYKQAKSLYRAAKDALRELELIEKKNRELKALIERKKKVQKLLGKANEAVKDHRVELAEQIFTQIVQLDPENLEVVQLRLELDIYKKKKEKEEIEKAAKKAERQRQEKALVPGKLFYIKQKWYSAIMELEKLVNKEKNLDKDLFDEADKMLVESKNNLQNIISPLLTKAQSLKEGKDLKGAYEQYLEILTHDPEHLEAFEQMREIKERLKTRSKKVYREAIISESLSLFNQAKEKFQEVQQISPIDSKYYKKATQKLKDYAE